MKPATQVTDRQPETEGPSRLRALRAALARGGHEYFLVVGLANLRYLTGFTGSLGYLVVDPESAVLYVDGRYGTQAAQQTEGVEIVVAANGPLSTVTDDIRKRRIRRLAFEQNRVSFETYRRLRENLRGRRLDPLGGVVETLRLIKSQVEVERIRRAVKLNSEAFERACRQLRPQWTEARLAAEIEYQMRRLGADGAAFDTIVAGGERSALPHAQPTRRRLAPKALIVVDQGAILDGYTSDMTRMLCLGHLDTRARTIFKAVREAQSAAVAEVRSGIKAKTVDRKARQVLRKFKLDKAFTHSTGHGLGLEIHEGPRLGPKQDTKLASGMIVTIEPGAYVEGVGGARLEDVVLVKRNGCEILTPTSRELRLF